MVNYRVQCVNLETGFTTIQIFAFIDDAITHVNAYMHEASQKYRITITTKDIQ